MKLAENLVNRRLKTYVFVILGCLMMLMCFSLLLETSLRDWSEAHAKRTAIVSFVALSLFGTILVLYFYSRFSKSCRRFLLRQGIDNNDEENQNQQQNTDQLDLPPTYSQIMGIPPAYHTIKIPNMATDDKIEAPDSVTHM